MKNLITIFAALTVTLSSAFASSTPVVVFSSTVVEVVSIEALDFLTKADFNSETQNLSFTTTTNISVVQIFNSNGDLEFQLPVMTNDVQINKNLFDKGEYKLGFILEGQTEVHLAKVTIK